MSAMCVEERRLTVEVGAWSARALQAEEKADQLQTEVSRLTAVLDEVMAQIDLAEYRVSEARRGTRVRVGDPRE